MFPSKCNKFPSENIRITARLLRLEYLPGLRIKRCDSMKVIRMPFCIAIAFSFFGLYMYDNRFFQPECLLEDLDHLIYIMSVNRSNIGNAQFLEEHPRNEKLFYIILRTFQDLRNPCSRFRTEQAALYSGF